MITAILYLLDVVLAEIEIHLPKKTQHFYLGKKLADICPILMKRSPSQRTIMTIESSQSALYIEREHELPYCATNSTFQQSPRCHNILHTVKL